MLLVGCRDIKEAGLKRETIKKNRIHAAEKKEYYTEREKYWARLEKEADDAEAMKIIRKKHITPEQLAVFNSLSEKEVANILSAREKETRGIPSENKDGISHTENEEETNENAEKVIS